MDFFGGLNYTSIKLGLEKEDIYIEQGYAGMKWDSTKKFENPLFLTKIRETQRNVSDSPIFIPITIL